MNNRNRVSILMSLTIIVGLVGLAPERMARAGGSTNGVAGSEPSYYDGILHTINLMALPSGTTVLAHNTQTNIIWQSDAGLPGGQPFISVINAIPGDGFNPLWDECQITFNPGHTPRQLFSDNEVAAAAASGEIIVTDTHELYRCSVIGKSAASTARTSGAPRASHGTQGSSWGRVKAANR